MHARGKVAEALGQALSHLQLEKHALVLERIVISPRLRTKGRRHATFYMGSSFPATVNGILIKYMKIKFGALAKHSRWPSDISIPSYSHTKNTFHFLPRGYNQKSMQSLHLCQNPGSLSNVQTLPLNLEMAPYGVAT